MREYKDWLYWSRVPHKAGASSYAILSRRLAGAVGRSSGYWEDEQ